ncbi:unnamed protein product [Soboliphyme baturini]|uniref:Homeobox domain-containing protein n=1 Tax=Soboliphyme baturini TaxID=241478 RepID=A0A183J131_9BILA|nr:unnamed protein product [Soboliphyme baturini]
MDSPFFAERLHMRVWFQNRRAKWRRQERFEISPLDELPALSQNSAFSSVDSWNMFSGAPKHTEYEMASSEPVFNQSSIPLQKTPTMNPFSVMPPTNPTFENPPNFPYLCSFTEANSGAIPFGSSYQFTYQYPLLFQEGAYLRSIPPNYQNIHS